MPIPADYLNLLVSSLEEFFVQDRTFTIDCNALSDRIAVTWRGFDLVIHVTNTDIVPSDSPDVIGSAVLYFAGNEIYRQPIKPCDIEENARNIVTIATGFAGMIFGFQLIEESNKIGKMPILDECGAGSGVSI